MKLRVENYNFTDRGGSPPAREVWIEITQALASEPPMWSPPAREVWIEISGIASSWMYLRSPPAREVWIEIPPSLAWDSPSAVTSREGGVD